MTTTQHLRELDAKATPGRWHENRGRIVGGRDDAPMDARLLASTFGTAEQRNADAALIVAMRNALPALLDVVDAANDVSRDYCNTEAVSLNQNRLMDALAKLDKVKP